MNNPTKSSLNLPHIFGGEDQNVKSLQMPTNAKWYNYILIRATTSAWKPRLYNNLQTFPFSRIKCCFIANKDEYTDVRTISDWRDITQVFKTRKKKIYLPYNNQ